MNSLEKRLHRLEEVHTPKKKLSAYIATIETNGKVTLSHIDHDTMHLQSVEELDRYIAENNLLEWQVLKVQYVNAKGAPPEEL